MAALYLISITSKAEIFLSILCNFPHNFLCISMGGFCFMIAVCSVIVFHKSVFHKFAVYILMDCASTLKLLLTNYSDFGCGFFILGCFSRLLNVMVFLFLILLGFKFLVQLSGNFKIRGKMMCSNDDGQFNGEMHSSSQSGTTNLSRDLCRKCGDQKIAENSEVLSATCGVQKVDDDHDYDGGEDVEEFCHEDEVFDVMTLRRMVKVARQKVSSARNELEKERMAASSSVDEAMAMILRLQNEKSSLQMRANQLERVVEEKQSHDQVIIQSLQWIIMKHESERSFLEDQLRLCREKLRVFMKGEEWDQFDTVCPTPSAVSHCSFESRDHDIVVGALDLNSSPM